MANSILLFLQFLIFCFPIGESFNSRSDLLSLLAFKSSLNDPHQSLYSWNQTTHFCNWTGILCDRKHPHRISRINLRSQGLAGTLSPHVGNLSFLKIMIIQNNSFHGGIPPEISRLRRLRYVEFSNNSFVGKIQRNLSWCRNLVYLNLIDNHLSGSIPPELGDCNSLRALGLSNNKLSGYIPPSIGNMTSLTDLSFASCGLKGRIPASLAELHKLEFLQLSENRLTGIIPSGLFNVSAMQSFDVSDNQLYGVLPSTLGLKLPNLIYLGLFWNHFSGSIPDSISNASLLENLELNVNHFTSTVPRTLGSLNNLRSITVVSNLIEDDIDFLSSFGNATNLVSFGFDDNLITGSLPDSIGNLSHQLKILSLSKNKIHGEIPSTIGNLISLDTLQLSENYLEGPIPAAISKLSKLQYFSVAANRFSNELPTSLGNLSLLNSLYLDGNNFVGNLPPSIGNCTMLLQLDCSRNNFNGLIPSEVLGISSVSIALDLSSNLFEGSIPNEVGSLKNLGVLDLSYNRLSGYIPQSLSRCMSLEVLSLEGNLLEGEIPSSLSALIGLRDLDISRNNLSGLIPPFLSKLNLEYLNLSFNRLQGEVPTTGIFKNKTSVSLDGNKELCGGILELKLPPCIQAKAHKKRLSTLLKILIPVLAVGGVVVVAFICKLRMSRKKETNSFPSLIGMHIMRFSYADLLKATGGFSEASLLGLGRFGSVYKGILDDGQTTVAVKVLNLSVRGASKSLMAECNALRNARHRNLLKILSVCESIDFQGNEFKALVYEFKANGSLEKWLHHSIEDGEGEETTQTSNLNMIQLVSIATDIAEAIEYLHSGTELSIVHGDLKPSNILLDHNMTAYVGDFGLAKLISGIDPSQESDSSTAIIRGTIGYVPPEYGTNRLVSRQGDVYSYGIVLLEMFTKKRPTDDVFDDDDDDVNLHGFVSAALADRVMEVVDPQLHSEMKNEKIKRCVGSIMSIGVSCSKEMAKERMLMTDVVNELHNIQKLLPRTR